eukprot:SM000009S23533  [mRNA]  locus=s9:572318:572857:- [translate_table: standard]
MEVAVEEEARRRAEVMEVAEGDLEVVVRGTQAGLVEGKVVEAGGQLEDCEEEGERLEVMALTEVDVVEVVEVEVELGAWQEDWEEEDWRAEVVEVALEEVGRRAEVMEEDLEVVEVVERGTQEGLVEEEVVEVGGQPEDCEGEGRTMEVMALIEVGVGVRESLEVVEVEVEVGV